MNFNVDIKVDGLDKLKKHISYVNAITKLGKDIKFEKYLQNKCMQELQKNMDARLIGGTTNDEYLELYRTSNHIISNETGFIIYNDAKIMVDDKFSDDYPNGEFSIALAFEYGTGIVGEGTYKNDYFQPWQYNVNNYNFGWYYKKGDSYEHTYGYEGFEVYRYTAEDIKNKLPIWVKEYYINSEVEQ